jgi:hypothetical protein
MIEDTLECAECDRLRKVYRRITRDELDLTIRFDRDAMRNDPRALEELRQSLAAIAVARATAGQNILDHENRHCSWIPHHEGWTARLDSY